MVHMSDIAWGISGEDALALHRKGEEVEAVVLDVDTDKERISLGMKQLEKGAPTEAGAAGSVRKGETVTVTVLEVRDGGLEVQVGEDGATGFIKRSDLGRDRDEQRPDRFQVGGKVDAMVTGFDRSKKPNFSIKARQIAEEKEAVQQFGSSDSGASLGDILGEGALARQLPAFINSVAANFTTLFQSDSFAPADLEIELSHAVTLFVGSSDARAGVERQRAIFAIPQVHS